ncbi:NAD-dependent succinate-semialdehyde dehydrogenase [Rhodohalobacter barkolensis]|uniref:Succinate-semialdehyde dehydrogenase n=1 Tax=Rhodohalobacter barkolensis TaxID=2053187 RepID=A0A2N0VJU7_9BACT|nr:NAD-dependent succinate-semialdehyde dehydrogenase [Rhodohalobacter barkolensis]PKD44438.1 succinate-semialdehyde dehydrogenase [Rhodohalobacter barkolensis]
MLQSINPVNEELIKEYEEHTDSEIENILKRNDKAFKSWRTVDFGHRADLMRKAGDVLRNNRDEYAELMTREMGKPISGARAEVDKCAWVCDYYAENGEAFLNDEIIETDASKSFVTFEPLGSVLAVMPWNFPFWQVFRFAVPGLMAGNAGLLKHASNVTGCALAIEDVFKKAGFPEDLFRTLKIGSSKVAGVIENPIIKAVTLTGSVPAGKAVAEKAGSELKKTVLELGGSDPYLILDDADIDKAIPTCVNSRLINNGQSCIAAKRFIVVESRFEEFEEKFVEEMKNRTMGDPMDDSFDLGPQARNDLRDELHDQVKRSIDKGAKCLLGGEIPDRKGAWYPPTVLTDVKQGMAAYEEELFGPVAAIIKAKDEEEAIQIANDSIFGLGAAVFTEDLGKGEKIASKKLNAGNCFVNSLVKSDPRLPFGGIKESGYGRELSHFGIKEFVNVKTVYVG